MIKYMPYRQRNEEESAESYLMGLVDHIQTQMGFLFDHYEARVGKPAECEQLNLFNQMLDSVTSQKENILIEAMGKQKHIIEKLVGILNKEDNMPSYQLKRKIMPLIQQIIEINFESLKKAGVEIEHE